MTLTNWKGCDKMGISKESLSYGKYVQNFYKIAENNAMIQEDPLTFYEYRQLAKEMRKAGSKNAPRDVAYMHRVLTPREARVIAKRTGIKIEEAKLSHELTYTYKGEEKVAKTARQAAFLRAKYYEGKKKDEDFDMDTAIYRDIGKVDPGETYDQWRKKMSNIEKANRKAGI